MSVKRLTEPVRAFIGVAIRLQRSGPFWENIRRKVTRERLAVVAGVSDAAMSAVRGEPALRCSKSGTMGQLDQQEYAALLDEAQPRLWTLAYTIIGDRTRAEDVVQDAAITGLRKLRDFDSETNFLAWMSQIVRYTALNSRTTQRNRKTTSLEIHPMGSELAESVLEETFEEVVSPSGRLLPDQKAFDDQVTIALERLEPDRRACLLLRTVHSLSYDEIAEIVGVPAGTAMSHVHRAKTALRGHIAGESTRQEELGA